MKRIIVTEDYDGVRLDRLLKKEMKGTPLTLLFRHLRKGNIKVNGKKKKQDYRLSEGDEIKLFIKPEELETVSKEMKLPSVNSSLFKEKFTVLYEDDQLLVCNKPSGLVVHPGSGHHGKDTLVHLANAYMKSKGGGEATLVHRLDRDTSGVILLAKTKQALRNLNWQLREHQMNKVYIALCHGSFKEKKGKIDLELVKTSNENDGMKMTVKKGGVQSLSSYRVISFNKKISQVEVELHTGKTHQIRVHLNHLGNPILGDVRYGDPQRDQKILSKGNKRLYLHAESLTFKHPEYNRNVTFNAPIPAEFRKLTAK